MSISVQRSSYTPPAGAAPKSGQSVEVKPSSGTSASTDFLKLARMTPAERLQAQALAKLGLSEEQFAQLDPKAKAEVTNQIRDEIMKQMQASGDTRTGMIADIKA